MCLGNTVTQTPEQFGLESFDPELTTEGLIREGPALSGGVREIISAPLFASNEQLYHIHSRWVLRVAHPDIFIDV